VLVALFFSRSSFVKVCAFQSNVIALWERISRQPCGTTFQSLELYLLFITIPSWRKDATRSGSAVKARKSFWNIKYLTEPNAFSHYRIAVAISDLLPGDIEEKKTKDLGIIQHYYLELRLCKAIIVSKSVNFELFICFWAEPERQLCPRLGQPRTNRCCIF